MILSNPLTQIITVHEVTDPIEIARARAQRQRFNLNSDWLQSHIGEVYSAHRGKFICVAGQELFVGDSVATVLNAASQAHPTDDGRLLRYVPRERIERIYAT
jgi:hypothetical protein